MKKILLILLILPLLSNCSQYTTMIGPSINLVQSGSVLQATGSLSGSLAIKNVKENLIADMKSENICPTVHSSELSEIFFETLEHMDCFYDPMSIYR